MTLSRRNLITASTCHIASLFVQCQPSKLEAVSSAICELPGAEVPVSEENGKLVVLLELNSEYELLQRTGQIETLPGVISSSLVFHQVDDSN